MSEPFIGEIRVFANTFIPVGWLPCDGRSLPMSGQYQALFAVVRNNFGGDNTTFKLPNLMGRAMAGVGPLVGGSVYPIGVTFGESKHTLTLGETPSHNHVMQKIKTAGGTADKLAAPTALANLGVLSTGTTAINCLAPEGTANATLAGNAVAPSSAQAAVGHENRQPYLALTVAIAWDGIFPVQP